MFLQLIGVFQKAGIALFCLLCTGEKEIICLWAVQYVHQNLLSEMLSAVYKISLIPLWWHILLPVFASSWPLLTIS